MTHGTQVVYFFWFDFGNDGDEIGGVAQVAVVKVELDAGFVPIFVDMFNAPSIETRRTTDNAMDLQKDQIESSGLRGKNGLF